MTEIALDIFGGLRPRTGDYLLSASSAVVANNCLLRSGELRGIHRPLKLAEITSVSSTQRIYRIPDTSGSDMWVPFVERTTYFVKGPVVNDSYDRYYWTDDNNVPKYNTLSRIEGSSPALILGIPAPTTAPSLSVTGGSATIVTRAYVYTFVSDYGEEGSHSPAVVVSGPEDGSWDLTSLETTTASFSSRNITKKRIYRTITDTGGNADYYFVAEIPIADTSYSDTSSTDDVALNSVNSSETFSPPPNGLKGLVAHPNGFLVGFDGRDIYLSEPYLPHAWPVDYVVSTEYDIVGVESFGTSIAICTTGNPYVLQGTHPSVMTLTKLRKSEPCVSRFGIVSMLSGVIYPSPNGLMFIDAGGIRNISRGIFTRDEWQLYDIDNILAAEDNEQYVAFDSATTGFVFDPNSENSILINLTGSVWNTEMLQADPRTSDILIVDNDAIYSWNPANGIPIEYTWRSRPFVSPKPINFGALKMRFVTNLTVTEASLVELDDYNALRFSAGVLSPVNCKPVNSAGDTSVSGSNVASHRNPVGGSALFNTNYFRSLIPRVNVKVITGEDPTQYQYSIDKSRLMYRLPAGYKDDTYQFEFIGNTDIQLVKVAETGKGLANV